MRQLGQFVLAFEGLEPYSGKLASTVLRGAKDREILSYSVIYQFILKNI